MKFGAPTAKPLKSAGVLILAGAMALQGCTEGMTLTADANDPSDVCNGFRQTIVAAQRTQIDEQVAGAVAGAAIGALLGAAVASGGTVRERQQGALIGAVGGGLSGLAATYYSQKAQSAADANALLRSVDADAANERALVTQTGRAAQALRGCRNDQLAALEGQVRSGAIAPDVARAELGVIRGKVAQDNQIISAAFNGIGNRVDAYVDASAAAAGVDRAAIAAARPPVATAQVTRARSFTPSVAAVVQDRNSAIAVDAEAETRVNNRIEALSILVG